MARPFQAKDQVEAALEYIKTTKNVVQLRRAQAVVLPLQYGFDLDQTAEVVGLSKAWVSRMRNVERCKSIVHWPWIVNAVLN